MTRRPASTAIYSNFASDAPAQPTWRPATRLDIRPLLANTLNGEHQICEERSKLTKQSQGQMEETFKRLLRCARNDRKKKTLIYQSQDKNRSNKVEGCLASICMEISYSTYERR
jgi:hypothetical protein